jgi:kinesin family protein 18/19
MILASNKNRTTEPTAANITSSRSHAVLQITVDRTMSEGFSSGKLSLIDLAGSERASVTQNRGMRLIEASNINRSLLALGNCINALYELHNKPGASSNKTYIPYRDSKLTRLLKDSLGGNAKTVMIACISPARATYEDTSNTLKYANRAKNIKKLRNTSVLPAHIDPSVGKYISAIHKLKGEIHELKSQLGNKPALFDKFHNYLRNHFKEEAVTSKKLLALDTQINETSI